MQAVMTAPRIVTKIAANPLLTAKSNSNRPLNVAAYCRVSTDAEDQLNSYKAQMDYYRDKIMKNPKWRFVDIYADEGITGTLARKRDNFLRMIEDCEKGKIDLILTKSVSRYARNVVDSLKYIRKLKSMGIGIFFEEQNINSLTEESETFIGIYSVIAQSESENISGNVKWGIHKRMQNGTYACRFNLLGYRRDEITKEPYIVPEEAEIVKKIFNLYLDGASIQQLKNYLETNHIKTLRGKTEWSTDTIRKMLRNEKYVGDVIYQKTFSSDPISKHVITNRGQKDKYLISNNHPAIIDRDTFMQVQTEVARRSAKRKTSDRTSTELGKYSGKYALSEILVCGNCGSPYKRTVWTKAGCDKRVYWRCLSRMEHGKKYCKDSKGIDEIKLHEAICRAMQKGINESQEVYALIKANLSYAISGSESTFDVFSIEKHISQKQSEVSNMVKLSMKSGANAEKYEAEITRMYSEIMTLRQQLKQAQQSMQDSIKTNEKVLKAIKWLEEHEVIFDKYDDTVVRRLADTIRVNTDETITVYLKGGIEITEQICLDKSK
ncbi:MAG: recombinase family protein [Clostridiales bacterium]|nr:recombinase family protein [Clostridiales bacterium]